MIRWDRNKHEINNGYEFEPGDDANVEQINGTINNALYAVDVADGLIEAPVVENPNPEEAPTVSFVDYEKEIDGVNKTVKKFKFTNIKGKRGEKGEKGDKGDSAVSFQVGSVVTLPAGSNAVATNVGTNQDVVLDLGIPKGDKGDTPILEFDTEPTKNSQKLLKSGAVYASIKDLVYSFPHIDLSAADYVQNGYKPIDYLYGLYYIIAQLSNGSLCDLGIRFLGYEADATTRYPTIPFSYFTYLGSSYTLQHGLARYARHNLTIPGGYAMLLFDRNNTQIEDYTVYYFKMNRYRG